MALPLYLALTAAEFDGCSPLPERIAWMACHFSPYGTGLSNRPADLPEGAMLILNDRTPIHGHDPELILRQLSDVVAEQKSGCVLLDFQQPNSEESAALARFLTENLSCAVGVSELYARELNCPVFLPPVPLDVPLEVHLAPWQGREVWLEAALDGITLTLTEEGCTTALLPDHPQKGQRDTRLHCRYAVDTDVSCARFHLWRSPEDLDTLLSQAENLGVTRAVGLWQELDR